jgi:hypothetical protein
MGIVKMRKLNNDGTPFMFEGEEVIRDFDSRVAENIMALKGAKWEVVEDLRKVKTEPKPARVEPVAEEPQAEIEEPQAEEESGEEEAPKEETPKKKRGRPSKK